MNWRSIARRNGKLHESTIRKCPRFEGIAVTADRGCTMHGARDDRLTGYDVDAGHPLAPMRVELTMELARALACLRAGMPAGRPVPARTVAT